MDGSPRGPGPPFIGGKRMDQYLAITLAIAAVAGIFATLSILRRTRRPPESPFASGTEGSRRCPVCGMGNLWNERQCSSCGADIG